MTQKDWYRYTDESGNCWRVKVSDQLAEIGGFQRAEAGLMPLPAYIKPRYVWLQEWPRPADRLPARKKILIERGRLKELWNPDAEFEISGKFMRISSYFGEVVSVK